MSNDNYQTAHKSVSPQAQRAVIVAQLKVIRNLKLPAGGIWLLHESVAVSNHAFERIREIAIADLEERLANLERIAA